MLLGVDTETTGLDIFHGCRPYLVTTCDDRGCQRTWQWQINPKNREVLVENTDIGEIQDLLDKSDKLVFHNAKFDLKVLAAVGIKVDHLWEKIEDTLFIAHMLASQSDHDLTSVVKTYLNYDISPYELKMQEIVQVARRWCRSHLKSWKIADEGLEGGDGVQLMPSTKGSNDKSGRAWMADTWLPKTVALHEGPNWVKGHQNEDWLTVTEDYADIDSSCLIPLFEVMWKEVERRGLVKVYRERLRILPVIHRMEHYGTTYKLDTHVEMKRAFSERVEELHDICKGIADVYGYDLELPKRGRNKSLDEFVFKVLNLPVLRTTDAGNPVFDSDVKEEYELTLPPNSMQQRFIKALNEKGEYDTALGYMTAYERFCILDREDINVSILHPNLNPTGTVGLRFSHTNPNCCDGDTEILTEIGWVKFSALTEGLEVAQFSHLTSEIAFTKPNSLIKEHYKGKMCRIKTEEHIDLLLTPNHRCLLENRKNGIRFDIPADSFKNDYKHLHAGKYIGGQDEYSVDQITWFCAVQADGSYQVTNGEIYGIRFAFKKQRKIDRLENCLKEMGTKYTKKIKDDLTTFYIGKNEFATQLVQALMPDKQFGPWLLYLCRKNLDQLLLEVFEWDGRNNKNGTGYSSSIKENSDWVQIVMCLSGCRSSLRSYTPDTEWSVSDHHYVNVVLDKNYSMTTNHSYETINWDDYVYCVTVPSGYIVIRRNGKVSITGNSANVSKHKKTNLRKCFGPRSKRIWYSCDYTNIELIIPAKEVDETELVYVFDHPEDPPFYGSFHMVMFSALWPELWADALERFGPEGAAKFCKSEYEDEQYQWTKNFDFACVPMDTLALTRAGWKHYEELQIGDMVLGYNDGLLEWTPVLEKVYYENADLVDLHNDNFSAIVTPNHRWVSTRRTSNNKRKRYIGSKNVSYKKEFVITEEITTEHTIILSAPVKDQPLLNISPDEAALIGFVYGDGSINKSKKGNGKSRGIKQDKIGFDVRIYQSKPNGIEYVSSLLSRLKLSFNKYGPRIDGLYTWLLDPKQCRDIWKRAKLWEGNPKDKNFEEFVLSISPECRTSFIEGVFQAEGNFDKRKNIRIINQNQGKFSDGVNLCIFMNGYYPTGCIIGGKHTLGAYCNRIREGKAFVTGQRLSLNKLPGKHPVWCIKTNCDSWVMRQGNRIMLTGNTQYGCQEKKANITARHPNAYRLKAERCPKIDKLAKQLIREAEKNNCVHTIPDKTVDPLHGFPIMSKRNHWGKVEPTTPLCYHVSSTAAQVLNKAMVLCDERLTRWRSEGFDAHMILTIHDELVFDFPLDTPDDFTETDRRANLLRGVMESASNGIGIPIRVSVERHKLNWAEGEAIPKGV